MMFPSATVTEKAKKAKKSRTNKSKKAEENDDLEQNSSSKRNTKQPTRVSGIIKDSSSANHDKRRKRLTAIFSVIILLAIATVIRIYGYMQIATHQSYSILMEYPPKTNSATQSVDTTAAAAAAAGPNTATITPTTTTSSNTSSATTSAATPDTAADVSTYSTAQQLQQQTLRSSTQTEEDADIEPVIYDFVVKAENPKEQYDEIRFKYRAISSLRRRNINVLSIQYHGRDTQNYPDKILLRNFFMDPLVLGGSFVEVGALDGVKHSPTYIFERYLGWNGLLIEPAFPNFERLASEQRRLLSKKSPMAVCAVENQHEEFIGEGSFAGRVSTLDPKLIQVKKNYWRPKWANPYNVSCQHLIKTLNENQIVSIDFLYLDINGDELEALKTHDFQQIAVRVIAINTSLSKNKDEMDTFLTSKGFCRCLKEHGIEYWSADPKHQSKFCKRNS